MCEDNLLVLIDVIDLMFGLIEHKRNPTYQMMMIDQLVEIRRILKS
jgi:hypothetical protein